VKVLDSEVGAVRRIFSSEFRIIIEAEKGTAATMYDQSGKNGDKEYSQYNPYNLFVGRQSTLTIDGFWKASHYDDIGN
jgi:hypothetical protein